MVETNSLLNMVRVKQGSDINEIIDEYIECQKTESFEMFEATKKHLMELKDCLSEIKDDNEAESSIIIYL